MDMWFNGMVAREPGSFRMRVQNKHVHKHLIVLCMLNTNERNSVFPYGTRMVEISHKHAPNQKKEHEFMIRWIEKKEAYEEFIHTHTLNI